MSVIPIDGRRHVCVIGAGIAGVSAAHTLQQRYRVTLLERERRIGGHTNTVTIPEGPDAGTPVDTGFIVLNNRTYPGLHRLFQEWGVRVRNSDMSFSFHDVDTGFHYAGTNAAGLFAQRRNIMRPRFWNFLREIVAFGRTGLDDLKTRAAEPLTLGEYFKARGFSNELRDHYVLPMGAAIWSTPPGQMLDYPAEVFLRFFNNHGLLALTDQPQWQTVIGGSNAYLRAFERQFSGDIRIGVDIAGVSRTGDGVDVIMRDGVVERFDEVVIATHADQALALLTDPSDTERELLGAWEYQNNHVLLHTDERVMPPRAAWASWNYRRESARGGEAPISATYHMNRLQGLDTKRNYCVTLNTSEPIDPSHVIAEFNYTHPIFTFESIASRARLSAINGERHTWFCGSYFGYGFHEDAVQSGLAVARGLGASLDGAVDTITWRKAG